MRTPLAWRNLSHHPGKLAASLAGVIFAVVLMFMQIGFRNALLDSTAEILRRLHADLFLVHRARYTLTVTDRFPPVRLSQAESIPGVQRADSVYIENFQSEWRNADNGSIFLIRAVGLDDFSLLDGAAEEFTEVPPNEVLADTMSKRGLGPMEPGVETELAGQSTRVAGNFALGTDFANDGNVLLSTRGFFDYFPLRLVRGPNDPQVDLGLVRLEPGANVATAQRRLIELLPEDVDVLTKDQMIRRELTFWNRATPVGFIFGLGTAMGFIVGIVICYQILFSDILEHLPEYATLKAMGYSNRFLTLVVLEEAVLLAILGFVPGLLLSMGLYGVLAWSTGLLLRLTTGRILFVLVLTLAMCSASAFLAIRRLYNADPAELFK